MKINFDTEILDLKGKPLPNGGDKAMTLGDISCGALINVMEEDRTMGAPEKVTLYRLAQVTAKGGVQELKAEDVATLKARIGKMYGALIVGRAYDLIEGDQ